MTRNEDFTMLRDDETASGTPSETCDPRSSRGARRDEDRLRLDGSENDYTNDEPRLPKGYRHIRSAIEAVLECSGEWTSL